MLRLMGDLLKLIWCILARLFRSRVALEAENVTLRHHLNVLQRKAPKRLVFNNFDRFVLASLYRIAPDVLNALVIVKPETVIRWHRAGFRLFRRWKSRSRVGRPKVPLEIRLLIRNISLANPFWGAPGSMANVRRKRYCGGGRMSNKIESRQRKQKTRRPLQSEKSLALKSRQNAGN
jgi:hypothetical protein